MSINRVNLSGYLGELFINTTQQGKKFINTSLSIKNGKSRQYVPLTAWFNDQGMGSGGIMDRYCHKGDYVTIEGHLNIYEVTDNTGKKYSRVQVLVDSIDKENKSQEATQQEQRGGVYSSDYDGAYNTPDVNASDLPF